MLLAKTLYGIEHTVASIFKTTTAFLVIVFNCNFPVFIANFQHYIPPLIIHGISLFICVDATSNFPLLDISFSTVEQIFFHC